MTTNTPQTTSDEPFAFQIRPAARDSLAYVLSTWGRKVEYRLSHGNRRIEVAPLHDPEFLSALGLKPGDIVLKPGETPKGFLRAFAPVQARIIKRSQVLTALTRQAGSTKDRIAGFVVYEPGVLHWIATRDEYRQRGVGRALLAAAGFTETPSVSFWTYDLGHIGLGDAPFTPFWRL